MTTLDVHVLTTDRVPAAWTQQCIDSITVAMRLAPFACRLYFSPEVIGDIWAARAAGFARGSAPYATYVDVDDFLHPAAFQAVAPAFAARTPVIVTAGWYLDVPSGATTAATSRGLQVVRRRDLEKLDFGARDAHCPTCLIQKTLRATHVAARVYTRRVGYNSLGTQLHAQEQEARHGT